ncbi:hypothetical protein Tco_0573894 [Tanacetum coccineum]
MSNAAVESPPSTPTGENVVVDIPVEISTPPIDLEMSSLDEGSNTSCEDKEWWYTMSGELHTLSSKLLLSVEEGPSVLSKSKQVFELMIMISASKNKLITKDVIKEYVRLKLITLIVKKSTTIKEVANLWNVQWNAA